MGYFVISDFSLSSKLKTALKIILSVALSSFFISSGLIFFVKNIWLISFFATIFILSTVIYLSLLFIIYSTQNKHFGTLALDGLIGKVTIVRDQHGIPHITAEHNDLDAFFALGFVHGQDRFWQMEFQRLLIKGKLSSVFGKKTIDIDKYYLTLNFHEAAKQSWDILSEQVKKIITHYTLGVNAFLENNKLPLPFLLLRYKPKLWTVIDTLVCQKMLGDALQTNFHLQWENKQWLSKISPDKLIKIRLDYPNNASTTLDDIDLEKSALTKNILSIHTSKVSHKENIDKSPLESFEPNPQSIEPPKQRGSNAWVISGSISTTGKPILANDTHLPFQAPNLWYLSQLHGPTLKTCGASLPGLPGILIGHNQHIAWGVTNSHVDTAQLYTKITTDQTIDLETTLEIRNKKPFKVKIQNTEYGPVINDFLSPKPDEIVALKLSSLEPNDKSLEGFIDINYADNWQNFKNAAQNISTPSINLLYADIEGNIGYQLVGKIPLIQSNSFETICLPLSISNLTSFPYIPFEHLPYVINPQKNFIASANNKIASDHYPYQLSRYWTEPAFRMNRIVSLIKSNKKKGNGISMSDMEKMQQDNYNEAWNLLKPYLLATKPLDRLSRKALLELQQWDGKLEFNSIASTIYTYWEQELLNQVNSNLDVIFSFIDLRFIIEQFTTNDSYLSEIVKCNREKFLSKTLKTAAQALAKKYGKDVKRWHFRNTNKAIFDGIGVGASKLFGWIWNRSCNVKGNHFALNYSAGIYDKGQFKKHAGTNYRQIIDLQKFHNSEFIIPLGQSGDPLSKNYDDLLKLWKNGLYVKFGKISHNSKTLVLLPK